MSIAARSDFITPLRQIYFSLGHASRCEDRSPVWQDKPGLLLAELAYMSRAEVAHQSDSPAFEPCLFEEHKNRRA